MSVAVLWPSICWTTVTSAPEAIAERGGGVPQRLRVESAQAVGVPVIAFANKPGKSQTQAGTNPHPDGVVIDLVELTDVAPRAYAQTER